MKYLESFKKLGMTADQSKIYEVLVAIPLAPARMIAQKARVGRELTYVVLGQLENLGLVERSTQGKIILFRAKNPRTIKKLVEEKEEEASSAHKAYQDIIGNLVSDYNMNHGKPFIRFYEGLDGLQKTYEHILKHAKTVYVIRSLFDYEHAEIRSAVVAQLEAQAKKGIRSYVISPKLDHMGSEKVTHNMTRNITRKVVPKEKLTLPSQIVIYNNTVSITSMKKEIITTVIENDDIAQTFKKLFDYLWESEV
ncbi:MAG: transcriptional regulator TrmB [Patescibacteria group bacterium]|nr:transcriptional regulator TrmB [Patescibacteria group bacterium]